MADRPPLAPDAFLLTGRRAIVTGAAAGIGRGIAAAFARFGADIALCDRDEPGCAEVGAEIAAFGHAVHTAVLDVRDAAAVDGFVADVAARFGGVDILVNNAGGGFFAATADVSAKGEEALIRENFTSVTACIRAVLPHIGPDGGSIVNVTSIEAHRAAPGFGIYSAMKAAVANLTKTLALELGDRHIRVNCIAPDVIPTPGVGDLPVKTPLPVAGHVDDVAAAAVYLASDAGRFVTGTTVHVDGGNWAAGGWGRAPDGAWVTAGVELAGDAGGAGS